MYKGIGTDGTVAIWWSCCLHILLLGSFKASGGPPFSYINSQCTHLLSPPFLFAFPVQYPHTSKLHWLPSSQASAAGKGSPEWSLDHTARDWCGMWDHGLEFSRTALLHGMSHLWEQDLWDYQGETHRLHKLLTWGSGNTKGGHSTQGFSTCGFTAQIYSGLGQTEHQGRG